MTIKDYFCLPKDYFRLLKDYFRLLKVKKCSPYECKQKISIRLSAERKNDRIVDNNPALKFMHDSIN